MTEKILKICSRIVTLAAVAGIFWCLTPEAEAQLRYGFRFGGDFAKASLGHPHFLNDLTTTLLPESTAVPNQLSRPSSLVNRSGFSGGLVLEYQFEKCGFAPDIALLYTRYNTRLALPDGKPHSFGRNFIEVPLHLKWKFWLPQTKNLFAPMVYTGPSFMFRVGHNKGIPYSNYSGITTHAQVAALGHGYVPTPTPGTRADLGDNLISQGHFRSKVFQPGWDVGIGFDVINFIQITAGYRFGLGDALASPSEMSLRTNAWNLSVNLLFDF